MPEPPLHQSSPHSSEDEARLLCGVQVESDLKKKKKNDREKEKENPILCGIEMEWMDFLGESS